MGAAAVRVRAVILDAVGFLPRDPLLRMGGGAHRVQLVVERPNSIPLELEVQEPVDVLDEVLQPVGRRWLSRQPVDVARTMLHDPQFELLVIPEIQLLRPQVIDLVLDQLLLVSDVIVIDWNELVGLVGVAVHGQSGRDDGHEVLQVV